MQHREIYKQLGVQQQKQQTLFTVAILWCNHYTQKLATPSCITAQNSTYIWMHVSCTITT